MVGPSGAGKSTVFQLLLRFYDPQHGRVHARRRGHCSDLSLARPAPAQSASCRRTPVIFSTSALENIRYGRRRPATTRW